MALFTLIICQSCRVGNLRTFSLQQNTLWPIEGRIVRGIDSVDVFAKNAIRVESGGVIAFRSNEFTDGRLDMQLTMKPGNSVTLQTRTTPYSDTIQSDPGVSIVIRNNTVTVEPVIPRVSVPVTITPDVPFIVEIVNDGHWIDVTVACTHIGRFSTIRPSTEWLILRSNDQAHCTLVDPTYHALFVEE
jgi:hypothetical protein